MPGSHLYRLTPASGIGAAFVAAVLLCSPANVEANESEEADGEAPQRTAFAKWELSQFFHIFLRDRGLFPCGDLNGDGVVDEDDLAIMELHIGYECSAADLNGDGVVDQADLNILDAAMQGPPSLCAALEE